MKTETFSLLQFVRQRLQQAQSGVSVDDVSDRVGKDLTRDQRDQVFQMLLRQFVQNVMTQDRAATSVPPPREPEVTPVGASGVSDAQPTAPPQRGTHASPRVAQRATWWDQTLKTQYNLDGVVWRLADLAVDQIEQLAASRHKQASELTVVADRLSRLAKKLRDKGLDKASDLSEEDAAACWGEAE